MDLHYLSHLALLGAPFLHPLGREGTERLEGALALRPGQRVLDLGCGTGATLVRLAASTGCRVDGVDLLPGMVRAARTRTAWAGLRSRTSVVRADARALPLPDRRYDRVYTESVLGFQPREDAERLLREVFRVLRPGGRYVANEAVWRPGTPGTTAAALHEAGVADFGLAQASPQPWSGRGWLAAMEETGFEVERAGRLSTRGRRLERPGGPPLEVAPAPPVSTPAPPVPAPQRWRAAAGSSLLTLRLRAGAWLDPSVVRERRRYRAALARHRDDGRHVEAWLFVLRRPSGEGADPTGGDLAGSVSARGGALPAGAGL